MAKNTTTKTIITHDGGYHSDDVFACATIRLWCEQSGYDFQIIRTRDDSLLAKADFVVDLGGSYDHESGRYDHHQKGGAGQRDNSIPYASFGLVWKHFGTMLCPSATTFEQIDQILVQPIDAVDNGVDLYTSHHDSISPYTIQTTLGALAPAWNEDFSQDEAFMLALDLATTQLKRQIAHQSATESAQDIIANYHQNSRDPRLLIVDEHVFDRGLLVGAMTSYPETLLILYRHQSGHWHLTTCRNSAQSFEARLNFPTKWGGLTGEELEEVTGVAGSLFCHPKLFLCGAISQDSALALAQLALDDSPQ